MRFCIVGTGRCGSTLLQRMMQQHPDLFIFPETHWIPKMYELFGMTEAPVDALVDIVARTTFVTGEPTMPADFFRLSLPSRALNVRQFADFVGQEFARIGGKQYWADKTPDYGPFMCLLQSLWPECRFVNLIRNGYHCAISMSRHPGYRWLASARETWWVGPSFNSYHSLIQAHECPLEDYLGLWLRRLNRIRDESLRLTPGSYLELRFEDLCNAPVAALSQLAHFVDLIPDRDWLQRASALVDPEGAGPRSWSQPVAIPESVREALSELGYQLEV